MFSRLLGGGYFPKELPPTFSTRSLGECAARHPNADTPLDGPDKPPGKLLWRDYEVHNLARARTLRRELAIVNPVAYWRLARLISSQWAVLKAAAERSPLSLTKPVEGLPRGLLNGRDLPAARARVRAKGKFVLQADVSNFYGSVYTHTISWALHGKEAARAALKNKKGEPLLGDKLDNHFRAMQDGQSVGLPVGPDASQLIAETILSSVDSAALIGMAGNDFRFVDDYELAFDSESEAITTRTTLQSVLAQFRLVLNPLKTAIQRLPLPLDDGWSRELWRMISRKGHLTRSNVVDYFDRAFDLARNRPTAGVLKFALGKLSKKAFAEDAQLLAESLVLQCGRVEAGCLPHVLAILLRRTVEEAGSRDNDPPAWRETLEAVFNAVIFEHAPQHHSSEVAWALWGCLGFNLPISERAAHAVLQMEDSVSSLLLYHSHLKGLMQFPGLFDHWKTALGPDDLSGSRWLLTYELARLGFTLDVKGTNYVTRDPLFGFLYREGVSFFDGSKVGFVPAGLLPAEEGDDNEDEEEGNEDEDEYSEGGFWDEWDDWPDDEEEEQPKPVASDDAELQALIEHLPHIPGPLGVSSMPPDSPPTSPPSPPPPRPPPPAPPKPPPE